MDAKPMTPADLPQKLRHDAEQDSTPGPVGRRLLQSADCIDAQAAEITALRAERDDLLARNHHGRRALAFADREAEKNETAMLAEIDRLTAERDALAARMAVPGEEAASMATRCTPEYAAGFWAGVEYGRHRPAGQHTDALQSDALSPSAQEAPDAE